MEEMKLQAAPELKLIPIERRNFPEADHKREKRKIQRKRKERDNAARGLIAVTVASMMLNAVMAMIIYILQAGPIQGGEQRNGCKGKERCRRRNELHLRST